MAHIINKDLKENKFSENAKTALVRPKYKKDDRGKIKDQSLFQKVFPKFMKDFYIIVYPTSEKRYFPNLFQLIKSLIVQMIFFETY